MLFNRFSGGELMAFRKFCQVLSGYKKPRYFSGLLADINLSSQYHKHQKHCFWESSLQWRQILSNKSCCLRRNV